MKLVFYSCLLFLLSGNVFSQSHFLQWVKQIGSVNNESGAATRVDGNSNMYILGSFSGTMDADANAGVTNAVLFGSEPSGRFVAKYDAGGNFLWVKTWRQNLEFVDFEITSSGNVVIGVNGSGDVDPGTPNNFQGTSGVLILDTNGDFLNYLALRLPNTDSYAEITCLDLDSHNNILVGGVYKFSVDFDPSSGTNTLVSTSSFNWYGNTIYRKNLFCWKLYANGTFGFARGIGVNSVNDPQTDNYVKVVSVETDSLKSVYSLTQNFTTPGGNVTTHSILTKIDSAGVLAWTKTVSTSQPRNLVVGKGVYLLSYSTTSNAVSTLKYDFAGNQIWTKSLGQSLIKVDKVGNLYSIESNFNKYDADGNLVWSSSALYNPTAGISDFAIDDLYNVFWTGYFNLGTTYTVNNSPVSFNSVGGLDYTFGKLSNCIYDAPNICIVTADSLALNNMIYWDETPFVNADSFIVYRYDALTTNYLRVGAVAASDPNDYLIDTARNVGGPNGGDPQYSSYRYKLAVRGTCGDIGTLGKYHESIFIQQNNQNFNWNAYAIEGQTSPVTGYQFLRDNNNTGTWQVLVNTGGLSTTDPNYLSYPNGNWRVDALGFSCNSTARINVNGHEETQTLVVKSKSNIKNTRTVGIKSNLSANSGFKVYPNPANDIINVEIPVPMAIGIKGEATIVIENMLGQVVYTMQTNKLLNSINTSNLNNGVYLVKIKSGNQYLSQKLIIQK